MINMTEYCRKWRKKFPQKCAAARKAWRAKNHEKTLAHLKVQTELNAGRLQRLPCEKCGNPSSQAHHEDYSKRTEIRWLCALHHKQRHAEIRESLRLGTDVANRIEL